VSENKEDRSSDDLTDDISQQRLEDYKRRGIVAQSKELSGMVALLATVCATYAISPQMATQLADYMREVLSFDYNSKVDFSTQHVLRVYLMKALQVTAAVTVPICAAGFISGALASFLQAGPVFTFETLTPDFSKVDPLQGFKRLFSIKHMVDGVRLTFKVIAVMAVAYFLIKYEILVAPSHLGSEPVSLFSQAGRVSKAIFLPMFEVLILFALIDYGFQRFEYNKNLRMTKQEAKQEHKEREGDPHVKARIRGIQREMARKRMMQAVKKADVIITNPTHFAVAIIYDRTQMSAPRVVAKGADFMAQRIKKIAADAGVPLVENVPLARALYASVKVNQNIPRNLYQAVAEVLAYVYRLKSRKT
jgi:flagellar biosynthetic protein FlhB